MCFSKVNMKRFIRQLLSENRGQDLIEYSLLLAFVALGSAGLFLSSGSNLNQVWSSANSVLTAAGPNSQHPPSDPGGGHHGGDGRD